MISRFRSYEIPDKVGNLVHTTIVFFGSKDDEFCSELAAHARDHFLKPSWAQLLSLSPGKIAELRQKAAGIGVTVWKDLAEQLWPVLAPVLDAGISYSIGLPVFLKYIQRRMAQGTVVEANTVGYWFLAYEGFIVTAHNGRLRTAIFRKDHPNASRRSSFLESWNYLRRKLQTHERARHAAENMTATDAKHGQESEFIDLEAISRNNWDTCPSN
jgi:hypothetical protein